MAVKMYLVALVAFFAIDLTWLGVIAKELYKNELGFVMSERPNWLVAIMFYLVFIVGIVFFVISPAVEKNSWMYALFVGMFFGFITYATYDLTNLATLKDWPVKIAIIDILWGSVLCGSVSIITFFVSKGFSS